MPESANLFLLVAEFEELNGPEPDSTIWCGPGPEDGKDNPDYQAYMDPLSGWLQAHESSRMSKNAKKAFVYGNALAAIQKYGDAKSVDLASKAFRSAIDAAIGGNDA